MDNSQTLENQLNRFGRDLQQQGIDATGYSKSDLEYLYNVSKLCAKQSGMSLGAIGGVTGAAIGGTMTIGTMTMPSYLVGFMAGFVGGTAKCVIARGAMKPLLDEILKNPH